MEKNDSISISAMLLYVLKKWKVLVIVALIGALIGGAFSYVQQKNKKVGGESAAAVQTEVVKQYVANEKQLKAWTEKNQRSIVENLDANEVYTGNLNYMISADSSNVNVIRSYYSNMLMDSEVISAVSRALSDHYENDMIRESIVMVCADIVLSTEKGDTEVAALPNAFTVSMTCYQGNEEDCKNVMDTIEKEMNACAERFAKDYPNFKSERAFKSTSYGYSQYVYTQQKTSFDEQKALLDTRTKLKATMTADDKEYFKENYPILANWEDPEKVQKLEEAANAQTDEQVKITTAPKKKAKVSKKEMLKYGVFGSALALVMAFLYMLYYIFTGKLKEEKEVANLSGLPVLACLDSRKEQKLIDGAVERLRRKHSFPVNDLEYAKNVLKSEDFERFVLSGDLSDSRVKDLLKKLEEEDRIFVGGYLSFDHSTQEHLKNADGVILVVHLWKMDRTLLAREMDVAKNNNKPVIGIITVR